MTDFVWKGHQCGRRRVFQPPGIGASCTATPLHRFEGALRRRYTITPLRRYTVTLLHWSTPRYTDTPLHRFKVPVQHAPLHRYTVA